MKLVSAREMRELERQAIESYGIPSVVLMELAGKSVADKCLELMEDGEGISRVSLWCGKGNNGGDGFVAARHLLNHNVVVEVVLLCSPENLKGDARHNYDILMKMAPKAVVSVGRQPRELDQHTLLVDAIFGTGFRGVAEGIQAEAVKGITESSAVVVSVDLPSGLEADTGLAEGPCVTADHTLTFGMPKKGLFTGRGPDKCGVVTVVDISLPEQLKSSDELKTTLITHEWAADKTPRLGFDAHKGDAGRVMILGGSTGMSGAVALASLGALRSGAGLVTVGIPKSLNEIMEVKLTEAMTKPLTETKSGFLSAEAVESVLDFAGGMSVLALGPGMGTHESTQQLVMEVLPELEIPMVIDADGLNILSRLMQDDPYFLDSIKVPVVLTPHPGEMARLTGLSIEEIQRDRLNVAEEYARKWGCVVVLKGANTVIATPDGRIFVNTTGNAGMATGGTGDVLTGVITSLIARKIPVEEAAALGVHVHGLAGDLAAKRMGETSLIAGDLVSFLPEAWKKL